MQVEVGMHGAPTVESGRRNRIKLLHYEAGGMVIYAKMLDRGTFGMPIPGSKDVVTSSIKWEVLIYL